MIKVSAAVIKYEDKILLLRRAPNQPYGGYWEFPGGKVKDGERTKAALDRELDEELSIQAEIGNLITSVPFNQYEIFAYYAKYRDGIIRLSVHDDMEWVTLDEALKYNLLPADRKIIMHMTKTKENKKSPTKTSYETMVSMKMSRPTFNKKTNKWDVVLNDPKLPDFKEIKHFNSEKQAIDFYVQQARKILGIFQTKTQQSHTK